MQKEIFLQFMITEIKQITLCLKLLSNLIDQLPFWIPEDGFEIYRIYNDKYKSIHNIYEETQANLENYEIRDLQDRLNHFRRTKLELTKYISKLLDSISETIKDSEIETKFSCLKVAFSGGDKEAVEENFSELVKTLDRQKTDLLKIFNCSQLQQFDIELINIQHEIYSFNVSLKDFCALRNNLEPQIISSNTILDKQFYIDLILFSHILHPMYVAIALRQKLFLVRTKHSQVQSELNFLRQKFGEHVSQAIRLQRIIMVFQFWNEVLNRFISNFDRSQDFTTAIKIQRLLTYEKKAFLKKCFAEQSVCIVIRNLYNFVNEERNIDKTNIHEVLFRLKSTLSTTIQKKESVLKENETYLQSFASTAVLGATQHPMFQLGQFTAKSMDELCTNLNLPILNEELPESWRNGLEYAVGLSFLTGGLVSPKIINYFYNTWINNSGGRIGDFHDYLPNLRTSFFYQLPAFSSIPLAQINMLFQAGQFCDYFSQQIGLPALNAFEKLTPNQLCGMFDWIRNYIRFDELGIIEKDSHLRWITVLGMILVMTGGQSIVPITLSYIAATSCREGTGWIIDKIIQKYDLNPNQSAVKFIRFMAQFFTYSYTFTYTQRLTRNFIGGQIQEQDLSYAEALKKFGLNNKANETNIKQKYRELALIHHPDKCETCDGTEMQEINKAYEVLIKKIQ